MERDGAKVLQCNGNVQSFGHGKDVKVRGIERNRRLQRLL